MSISSEIERISKNVSDSLAAVAEKGVTVAEGANSDALPGLIEQIELGVKLPTLTAPASDAEVFEGKEYIKQDGTAGAGTFTLTNEISEQASLITQIKEALEGKSAVGYETCTITLNTSDGKGLYSAISALGYTSVENGELTPKYIEHDGLYADGATTMVLENVLRNSFMNIFTSGSYLPSLTAIEIIYNFNGIRYFRVKSDGTITMQYQDF